MKVSLMPLILLCVMAAGCSTRRRGVSYQHCFESLNLKGMHVYTLEQESNGNSTVRLTRGSTVVWESPFNCPTDSILDVSVDSRNGLHVLYSPEQDMYHYIEYSVSRGQRPQKVIPADPELGEPILIHCPELGRVTTGWSHRRTK